MKQEIENNSPIEKQVNVVGTANFAPKTRWRKKFEKLKEEVENDKRYETFIDDFNDYNTIKDGIGLEQKLKDAGFSKREIIRALTFKDKYARRVVKGEMYLSQQEIDVEIFSIVDSNFYTYVFPKIEKNEEKNVILETLMEKVIQPILDILNREGESDNYLNYNSNHIYGMIFFLTGKCHLNWKDYDIV
ncbi:conserved hypothetical protein [Tenacibaculum maritimum]|uniref:ABC-three component system protein n=1 Tax=Tenacibaculum maritimum TaxID=107401 RepID=UPI0012E49355|nr:ABC-three component system protein [Tenacibaculum maritimum]MCD9584034.1 hypothetical protein [Tenacibaculum maritimum]CAA0140941.1 conserved hypothetical protein [Tenacibaculum maritimum]